QQPAHAGVGVKVCETAYRVAGLLQQMVRPAFPAWSLPVTIQFWAIRGEPLAVQADPVLIRPEHRTRTPAEQHSLHGFRERLPLEVERRVHATRPETPAIGSQVQLAVRIVDICDTDQPCTQ